MRSVRLFFAALATVFVAALAAAIWSVGWADLWSTPDQRGRGLMEKGRYVDAAAAFADPIWRGAALMKAGAFKEAAQAFGGIDTAVSAYDQGNALVMLGKYDEAIGRYDRALALRPSWPDAEANRTLARLRAEKLKSKGGDAGDQREGADEIVYDKDKKDPSGEETRTTGSVMTDEAVRALWLKRVQTRPADFLKARFLYQLGAKPAAEKVP
jgi:Ca-activated chloride channel family protein